MIIHGNTLGGDFTPVVGTISAGDGTLAFNVPGDIGAIAYLALSWTSTNASVPTLQWYMRGGWVDLYRVDGSINGQPLPKNGLLMVRCDKNYRLICHSADFVSTGVISVEVS